MASIYRSPPKTVPAGPGAVIYAFHREMEAVEEAVPGETVVFRTLDCFGGSIDDLGNWQEPKAKGPANPATGPLHVKGAELGDTLAVDILDMRVGREGRMGTGGSIGEFSLRSAITPIPVRNGLLGLPNDVIMECRPMVGVIGVAPAEGCVPTSTPGPHGGNLDAKVIAKGSTVYLPVSVPGGLLAMGDLHALMGDGEISGFGVEIPGEVEVRVRLVKNYSYGCPIVETDAAYYVMSSGTTLDEAASFAVEHSLEIMVKETGCTPEDGISLLSACGNLQINQIVNPLKTVRMEIPKIVLRIDAFS